jgi:hypothetical protein
MRTIIIFLFCLMVSSGFSQSLNDSLILFYPFDGNALDSSENKFHGITNATFTMDRLENPNGAIHFNGIDQYLDFPPNKPKLKPQLPVSFSFWILFEDSSPFVTQIFTTDYDQNNHSGVWVSNTGYGALGCGYGDGTQYCSIYNRRSKYGTTVLSSNTWYFTIVILRDSMDMSIYLDGIEEDGYYEGYGGPLAYTDCQGSIGRKDAMATYPPDYFYGAIDDFRYWHKALSDSEIDSLCVTVNLKEFQSKYNSEISLCPNPANDFIKITNLPEKVTQMEMIDSQGILIRSFPPVSKFNISDLLPGIYFIRFIDERKGIITYKKFIKT